MLILPSFFADLVARVVVTETTLNGQIEERDLPIQFSNDPAICGEDIEDKVDALMTVHTGAVASFQTIIRTARDEIRRLHFPLGCPAAGYGLDDIDGSMTEWLEGHSEAALEAAALDLARETL